MPAIRQIFQHGEHFLIFPWWLPLQQWTVTDRFCGIITLQRWWMVNGGWLATSNCAMDICAFRRSTLLSKKISFNRMINTTGSDGLPVKFLASDYDGILLARQVIKSVAMVNWLLSPSRSEYVWLYLTVITINLTAQADCERSDSEVFLTPSVILFTESPTLNW